MTSLRYLRFTAFALALLAACSSNNTVQPASGAFTITNQIVTVNPSGYAPLTALIHVETSTATRVSLTVPGKNGPTSDVVRNFDDLGTSHDVPVLGLYAEFSNNVQLIFRDASGIESGRKTVAVQTSALPTRTFPAITINTRKDGRFAPGMTLVSYFGYNSNSFPQSPFVFDAYGDVRWYLDYSTNATLANLFYDDGVERLQNGNLYFGDVSSGAVYEVDMLGRIVNSWPFPGYSFHHEVHEKPNGNFLVTVTRQGISTTEDFIIEINRATKQIIRTWDLRSSLQVGRQTLITDPVDWVHVNAVLFDASDNTIIVSGRTQALVKLDSTNRVVWILGAHKGWGTSGNGIALAPLLLQPLDAAGQPITNQAVLDGDATHPDFEWNWYQHAPLLMPNGHVMLFDNGDNRNFGASGRYSRAVEYEIDATRRTVKQIWAYGKAGGASTYSRIVSDVDFLNRENHVVFSPGAIADGAPTGKVIELDYATQEVVFQATLTPPNAFFGITFHRTERIALYP